VVAVHGEHVARVVEDHELVDAGIVPAPARDGGAVGEGDADGDDADTRLSSVVSAPVEQERTGRSVTTIGGSTAG
jgi:hypothetical protein